MDSSPSCCVMSPTLKRKSSSSVMDGLQIRQVMYMGDFNAYVCRHIDGFDGVHGGYGVGQRNLDGRMLLVLSGEGIMCVKYIA